MDSATLRADFPEFSNPVSYPDSLVNFWLSVGSNLLNPTLWGNMLNHGLELFTAHHLVLSMQDQMTAAVNGAPGANKGPVASKTVDKVSIAYNSDASVEENAGHYNQTTYGAQFIRLARMLGAGGVQVQGGCFGYLGVNF